MRFKVDLWFIFPLSLTALITASVPGVSSAASNISVGASSEIDYPMDYADFYTKNCKQMNSDESNLKPTLQPFVSTCEGAVSLAGWNDQASCVNQLSKDLGVIKSQASKNLTHAEDLLSSACGAGGSKINPAKDQFRVCFGRNGDHGPVMPCASNVSVESNGNVIFSNSGSDGQDKIEQIGCIKGPTTGKYYYSLTTSSYNPVSGNYTNTRQYWIDGITASGSNSEVNCKNPPGNTSGGTGIQPAHDTGGTVSTGG